MPLDREDPAAEPCQDRGLIPRTGADLESIVPIAEFELLGHQRHHIRLTDRLTLANRPGHVFVSLILESWRHELLPRCPLDRPEHPRVADPGAAQLQQQPQLPWHRTRLAKTCSALGHSKTVLRALRRRVSAIGLDDL